MMKQRCGLDRNNLLRFGFNSTHWFFTTFTISWSIPVRSLFCPFCIWASFLAFNLFAKSVRGILISMSESRLLFMYLYAILLSGSLCSEAVAPRYLTLLVRWHKTKIVLCHLKIVLCHMPIIVRYKRIRYNINIMRQSACLVFNPITVNNFASLFNCMPVSRASDSMMAPT